VPEPEFIELKHSRREQERNERPVEPSGSATLLPLHADHYKTERSES